MKKFLIISIFSFSLFLGINKVKAAVNGSELTFDSYTISYEEQERQNCWYKFGSTIGAYGGVGKDYYLCSSNRKVIGFKNSGVANLLSPLTVYSFDNYFDYQNVYLWSYYYNSTAIILSSGDLPTMGGSCSSGSFCFNIINSGSQGNGRSATANSDTILISDYYYRYFTSGTYFGTSSPSLNVSGSTCSNYLTYSTQNIYNNSGYQYNCNFNLFELQNSEPEFSYSILDGTEKGKKLQLLFTNFNEESSSAKITDLSSGQIYNVSPLNTGGTTYSYEIDNITFDSSFLVEAYNNEELVVNETIDVESELLTSNKPYIDIYVDREELSSIMTFHNTKSNQSFYYSLNNGPFVSTETSPTDGIVILPFGISGAMSVYFNNSGTRLNKNYVIRGQIRDSNDQILYDKSYNVILFENQPYFTFNSSYNNTTGASIVNITYHNPRVNDVVSYSYDNTSFIQFDNVRSNKLEFYMNSPLYVKASDGNSDIYGYFYVNLKSFESSVNSNNVDNKDLLSTFKDIFTGVNMQFLDNFTTFFNSLKNSFIYKYLLLIITGAFILLIMKLIRR